MGRRGWMVVGVLGRGAFAGSSASGVLREPPGRNGRFISPVTASLITR